NQDLQLYSKAIADVANARGKQFIDLYNPVVDFQKQTKISEDGIHLNEGGYYLLATALAKGLGSTEQPQLVEILAGKTSFDIMAPGKVYPSEEHLIKFTIEESYLPLPLTANELPNADQKRTIKIDGLKKGF